MGVDLGVSSLRVVVKLVRATRPQMDANGDVGRRQWGLAGTSEL